MDVLETKNLRQLQSVVTYVRTIHSEMPIQQLLLLLEIAANPSITQSELSDRYDMHSGTVSRHLKTLSLYIGDGKRKGFDLIEQKPDLAERRKLACFPTQKGVEVAHRIAELMGNGTSH